MANPFKILLLLSIIISMHSRAICQPMVRWDSIPVKEVNKTLSFPWAGGLNNPQFSAIDMDGDNIKDLFIFDRNRSIPLTFINGGTSGQVDYTYAPEYRNKFPYVHSWVLLADYDQDGKEDIFTSYTGGITHGISVYHNITASNGLEFELVKKQLTAMDSVTEVDIFVSEWDVPGIKDIDGDGDLDIITFDFQGSFMQYYRNMSIENYSNSDSLDFVYEDKCWGSFEEDFAYCSVTLNVPCRQSHGIPLKHNDSRHAGSTILPIDLDGDNDMEVIVGDIICTNVYMLTNGGDNLFANMSAYLPAYPASHIVDIQKFPATFFVDVDNDNLKDFLAAPNALEVSENYSGMWFYKNIGTQSVPDFIHQTDSFLVDEMIEVGSGANPAFFDYNGDSLQDLVIGNFGYYQNTNPFKSCLALYKNTGTADSPSFELVDRDYLGISNLQAEGIYPTFGDMDGDGDEDMILGESGGHLFYYTNTAGVGNEADFTLTALYYKNIDVGSYSTPQIVDVDRDWKPDLLIGESDGTINYFQNIGTSDQPDFNSTPTIANFGEIDVSGNITGYSSPALVKLDTNGQYSLLVGSELGNILRYDNIDGNLNGQFTLTDTMFENINEGIRSSIGIGDLNMDGATDIAVGNYGGGLLLFRNTGDSIPPDTPPSPEKPFNITIYPNPASEYLNIQIDGTQKGDWAEIQVYDVLGNLVYWIDKHNQLDGIYVNTKVLSNGIYFCKVTVHTELDVGDNVAFIKFLIL